MPALTTADQNTLNMFPQSTRLGMAVFRATGIVSGQISGTPARGATSLTLASISTVRTPYKHYTVIAGSSAGASDGGKTRMKSWSSPTLTVAANNIAWSSYTYITILEEILPWAIIPDLANDYEDGNVSYTNENLYYHPLGRIGPPAVGWTDQAINFWSSSAAVASGASLSTHAWTFPSGDPASSASAGTAASPIAVTWSSATGHTPHYVIYTVTDSNSKSHTRYCPVWVFDDFDDSYCDWELESLTGDYDSGGWTARIRVFGDATATEFPEDAMCVIFAEDRYGGHKTSIGGNWDHRQNIVFVGWIVRDTVMKDDEKGDVSFELAGPTAKMKELNCWPANLEYTGGTPNTWHKLKGMTCDLAAFHLITEHTTMDHICDVVLTSNTKKLRYVDIPEADPYQQVDEYCLKPIGARLLSDRQGRLYMSRNPNLRPESERTGIAVVTSLTVADCPPIRADPGMDLAVEEHEKQVAQVDFVAFGYDGADARPWYSLAPEFQYEYGRVEKVDGIRADNQSECNELAGLYLANLNNIWRECKLPMFNWRVFDIVPEEYTYLTLAASDTRRGIAWTNQKLICRAMEIEFDVEKGQLYVNPTFERDTSGPAGITGDYPVEPPQGPWDYPAPPAPEWPIDTGYAPQSLLILANGGDEIQYAPVGTGVFEDRTPAGITSFLQLGWDPWWFTPEKQATSDPEQAIIWACKQGAIYRSTDCGKTWTDVTPTENPPNDWSDATAPTVADVSFTQRTDNIHKNKAHYFIAEWQNASSQWRGWLLVTLDDGVSWTWYSLHDLVSGGSCDDTYCYAGYSSIDSNSNAQKEITVSGSWGAVDAGGSAATFTQVYKSGSGYIAGVHIIADLGFEAVPDGTSTVNVHVKGDPTDCGVEPCCNAGFFSSSAAATMQYSTDGLAWTNFTGTTDWEEATGSYNWKAAATTTNNFRYIRLTFEASYEAGQCDGWQMMIDSVRANNISNPSSAIPTEVRPIWMDTDSEDGDTLFMTVWADDSLYLMIFNLDDLTTATAQVDLGGCTSGQLDARTYYAAPYTPTFNGNLCYLFGRMNHPDLGACHLVEYNVSGASSTAKESGFGNDHIGAFRAEGTTDSARTYYAIRNSSGDVPRFYRGTEALALISSTLFPSGSFVRVDGMSVRTADTHVALGSNTASAYLIIESADDGATWDNATNGLTPSGDIYTVEYV